MPLYDHEGNVIGTFGISRDITRRKRAESVREALFQISEAVYTAVNIYNLYQQIHEVVGKLMHAKNFSIVLYDERKQMLSIPYFDDELNLPQPPRKNAKGLVEYVLKTEKPELINAERNLELRSIGEIELVGSPKI
jgi:transcriptional regulator with GAF, ATPase, and Fis domain